MIIHKFIQVVILFIYNMKDLKSKDNSKHLFNVAVLQYFLNKLNLII